MVEEVAKNIYRIGVVLPDNPLKELNSYLIRGKHHDVLIDTGFRCEECRNALSEGLRELGSEPERRDVLLTHIHSDHSGLSDLFAGPGRHVYLSRIDLDYQIGLIEGDINRRRNERFVSEGFDRKMVEIVSETNPAKKMAIPAVTDAFEGLNDGAIIGVGDYKLKLILVPGHTPGNAMYYAQEQGILFSGDHILFDITPNITQWEYVDDALGAYLDSLQKVIDLPVRMTLPGHRKSGDYRERVEALLRHHKNRLAEVQKIIIQQPGLTAYEIAGRMTWHIKADSWEDFPMNQKWFAVGECLSHLDYLRKREKIVREQEGKTWHYYPTNSLERE